MWGEDAGSFVSEDAQVGVLAQLRCHATRGSAPSTALGRLEDGAPATRDRLRCWGSAPPRGAPTTIDTGALRTEPPLCVTGRDARISSTHDICHVQVMTLCTAPARKPEV